MSNTKIFSATSDMTTEEIRKACLSDLKKAGFRLTKARERLVDLFIQSRRYISAVDVHEYLSQDNPTMSLDTTYRNLYDFTDIGMLDMTEYNGQKHFRLGCFSDHGHHHHFICKVCQLVTAIDVCPLEESVKTDLSDYIIESHKFEIYGICPNCQDN